MWNKNIRLRTLNKKHVYKERKETTHEEIGEMWKPHHQIYISKISTMFAITKWSQEKCTGDNVSKRERKEKI